MSVLFGLVLTIGLSACGGGGDGGCNRHNCYTHAELARDFVNRSNQDTDYNLELVKADTNQRNYIVVRDKNNDRGREYLAVNIEHYVVGDNVFDAWDNADTAYVTRSGSSYYDRDDNRYSLPSSTVGGNVSKTFLQW